MEIETPVTPAAAKYRCASPDHPDTSRTEIMPEIGAPATPNEIMPEIGAPATPNEIMPEIGAPATPNEIMPEIGAPATPNRTPQTAVKAVKADEAAAASGASKAPEASAAPGAIVTGPITLTDPRSAEIGRDRPRSAEIGVTGSAVPSAGPGRQGRLCGLRVEHFYETAITVLGGWWTLENLEIVSSQAPKRACVGVLLRAAAHVDVVHSVITGASSVITLGSPHASLVAHDCTFGNTRAAIASERGGKLDVRRCSFSLELPSDVGFRLAADTRGFVGMGLLVSPTTSGGSLWGRVLPPKAVCVEAEEADEGAAAGAS
ncbi:hypothetical protein Ctob_009865 [Chrysochromulina tobinii]|uniref:Right handed beta helix domain-containing protein n=1 Tax=Chrysochromulina tobinii TaxID=1460289 RepID=A0A0M0JRX4_9EUKA|nr:hypothetical protein Ctob_009865 [Chrysochromulina tobinii]|eukprot:KOO29366.1 hypothetical protein Ctob_009865 [Chrysochromulina sp. CCMP291]